MIQLSNACCAGKDAARVIFNLCQEVAPDSVGAHAASATSRAKSPGAVLHARLLGVAAMAAVASWVP